MTIDGGNETELTSRQQQVKQRLGAEGPWDEGLEAMLRLDPEFLDAYAELAGLPRQKGHLAAKDRELIRLAIDAASTHMYASGTRRHLRQAIELGATQEELIEVLELTATLGIHGCNIGVPLLLEVLAERGEDQLPDLDERRRELKAEFVAKRGYWHDFWLGLLQLDPELFAAYLRFSSHPWDNGVLEPKVKEMIYIAFDASATHLFAPGLKLHIRNALELGASLGELMEVFEIVSVVGIHGYMAAAPALAEELDRAARAR